MIILILTYLYYMLNIFSLYVQFWYIFYLYVLCYPLLLFLYNAESLLLIQISPFKLLSFIVAFLVVFLLIASQILLLLCLRVRLPLIFTSKLPYFYRFQLALLN